MDPITFYTSNKFIPEKTYCLGVIEERINQVIRVVIDNEYEDRYAFEFQNGRQILFADSFFSRFSDGVSYIDLANIPSQISRLNTGVVDIKDIPVIYGKNSVDISAKAITLDLDIIGSMFFMLSRWEEIASATRDKYDRFAGKESTALKFGFLLRPVVDEYIELLRSCMTHIGVLQPSQESTTCTVRYSCDVDHLTDPVMKSKKSLLKSVIKSFLRNNKIESARSYIHNYSKGINSYDCFD